MNTPRARTTILSEALGWYGVGALLLAFALVSFEIIEAESEAYQLLNLTGAVGVAILSLTKRAYQPAVLNSIWAIIALAAMISILV
jgi:hypothetical protein